MAAASVYVPRGSRSCLLLSGRLLKIQQMSLTQPPFILFPLFWVMEHAPFSSGVSVSYQPSCSPICKLCWPLKRDVIGAESSQCRNPRLGSPMWSSNPLLLGENLCNCDSLPICGSPTQK